MKGFGLRRLLFPIGIFAATQFMSCKTDDAVEDLLNDTSKAKEYDYEKGRKAYNYRYDLEIHTAWR